MKYIINRRKFLELFSVSCCGLILPSCSTVPITKRKQLTLFSEARINAQAATVYEKFKNNDKTKLIKSSKELTQIKDVGNKIQKAVTAFFLNKNEKDPTSYFDWEYILVDNDKMVNAWCMPGGKIAFYTGILKITKNIDALAVIMGHEIAHAVAKHSIERQSQAATLNLGTQVADIFLGGAINRTRNTVGQTTGMDILRVGVLNPFGRQQETEADYLGLIFSSLAGFDIRESVKLWQRMADSKKGKEPPQFLSTHPSSSNRIINLSKWINEVIIKYPPIEA